MTAARDKRPERPMVGEPDKKRNFGLPRKFYFYEHGAPSDQPLETQWLEGFPQAAIAWLPEESFVGWHRMRTVDGPKRASLLAISSKGDRYEIGVVAWEGVAPTHKEFWLGLPAMDQMSRIQSWEHLQEFACRRRASGYSEPPGSQ